MNELGIITKIDEIEYGFYAIGVKGKIMLTPFNNSSKYRVYCVNQGDIIWWYNSDDENNIKESIKGGLIWK